MRAATITRGIPDEKGNQVKGKFISENYSCDTLEKFSRLIKAGIYRCAYTRSPRLSTLALANWIKKNPTLQLNHAPDNVRNYFTYEILGVDGRSGLRIHPDNLSVMLDGCVAPGHGYADINSDGTSDITNSGMAAGEIRDHFDKQDFMLTIVDAIAA